MNRKPRLLLLGLLLALTILLIPHITFAQGPIPGDKVIFGGTFTLTSGQSIEGDLVIFGGMATVQQNAEVDGDVVIIGGTATIDGQVDGDVVALGGTIHLGSHAEIHGDATAIGGIIQREPGAQVHGNIVETDQAPGALPLPDRLNQLPEQPEGPQAFPFIPDMSNNVGRSLGWLERAMLRGLSAITWTAILAALGIFLILIAPQATERVAKGIQYNLVLSFVVGLLTTVILFPMAIIMALTLCLLPLAFTLILAWLIALFFGWLALGWLLGRELLRALQVESTPLWESLVGVTILTLLWKLPTIFPCVGQVISFLVLFVAGNIALGAVILTRFGTRDYPATPATPSPPPPPPPPDETLPETSVMPPEAPTSPPLPSSDEPLIPPPPPSQ